VALDVTAEARARVRRGCVPAAFSGHVHAASVRARPAAAPSVMFRTGLGPSLVDQMVEPGVLSCGRQGPRQARLHAGAGRPSMGRRQPQAPRRRCGCARARTGPPCASARRWCTASARHPCTAARLWGLEGRRARDINCARCVRQRAGAPTQVAVHQDNAHRPMDLRAGAARLAEGGAAGAPADWPLLAAASEIAAEARAAVKVGALALPFCAPRLLRYGAQPMACSGGSAFSEAQCRR